MCKLPDLSGNVIAETNGSNNIQKYYIHGLGLLAMVDTSDNGYTYHYDGSANTVAMTDGNQDVVRAYSYTPYGQIANESGTLNQPFTYVGQYGVIQEPNGLYFMRARYYDSAVGRFISEEPIGFDGGQTSLYAYVGGNPVMFVDPSGLELRVYSADAWGKKGVNHTYVWSTELGQGKGTQGSSGLTLGDGVSGGPNTPYSVVADLNGMTESEALSKIRAYPGWNSGQYCPFANDCHTQLERAFEHAGIKYPGAPDGRIDSVPSLVVNTIHTVKNTIMRKFSKGDKSGHGS